MLDGTFIARVLNGGPLTINPTRSRQPGAADQSERAGQRIAGRRMFSAPNCFQLHFIISP